MRIAMMGAGYVGLVTGACLAEFGHQVTCIDNSAEKIAELNRGRVPIYEPGLPDLVERNVSQGRLKFTAHAKSAIMEAAVVFIGVGTPPRNGEGRPDLSQVYTATNEVAAAMGQFTVIAMKSTVPVGTCDEVERLIRAARPEADFAVVSNPEFLREGAGIYDFTHPDRIVVGTDNERARGVMAEVYRPLYLNGAPILVTNRRSAELIKYAANAFLATKIAFINEIADLAEKVGADVQEIARGVGLDNRIGTKFLHAGPGFGGSCLPKDTMALIQIGQDHDAPQRIVETVAAINDQRKRAIVRKVSAVFDGNLSGKTIAVLGLSFKPNTDDMRDAPSIPLIAALQNMGAIVRAHDPASMENAKRLLSDVTFCDDPYDCAQGSDALVIVTEWHQFRALDLARLKAIMIQPVLIDLRNIYRPEEMAKHNFYYCCVGKAPPPTY